MSLLPDQLYTNLQAGLKSAGKSYMREFHKELIMFYEHGDADHTQTFTILIWLSEVVEKCSC